MQSVYSAAPVVWTCIGGVLPLCRDVVGVFCRPRRMGHFVVGCFKVVSTLKHCILILLVSELKPAQIKVPYRCFMSLKWAIMSRKQPKTFVERKVKAQLIIVQKPDGGRNFLRVATISTVRQYHVGLRPWNSLANSKLQNQIQWVALGGYPVSSAFHSPMFFVIFMCLAERIWSCQIVPHVVGLFSWPKP